MSTMARRRGIPTATQPLRRLWEKGSPSQWQAWWWICFAAQVVSIPLAFLLTGYSNPRKARAGEREHERTAERELARLQADRAAA
jgi:hypothetical protein